MPDKTKNFFDIYLWTIPNNDKIVKLFKIEHLTYDETTELSSKWLNYKEACDYAIVLEGSTPFINDPAIEVKTKEWIESI